MAEVKYFFATIGAFFVNIWVFLEHLFIIWPIEIACRIWYMLDPALYFRSLRIVEISEGAKPKNGDAYFIFALYTKTPLPAFTQNILDAIVRSGHNLVVVSHNNLSESLRENLLLNSHMLIERKGLGRDFGAYKDSVETVLERYPDAQRIILLNDSCFFLDRNLDALIGQLMGPQDYIGLTEVFQYHYHVQSFMLSFGPSIIHSGAFRKFWRKYKPISTRRWSIHHGELQLTRKLTKAGFRPHILYQAAELARHLNARSAKEAIESVKLLPTMLRETLLDQYLPVVGHNTTQRGGSSILEAVSFGVSRKGPESLRRRGEDPIGQIDTMARTLENWSVGLFTDRMTRLIATQNQMHCAGFLFMKYMGLPLFKRDIFYRNVYTLEEIYDFLNEIDEPMRDEIMGDLRRAGTGELLTGLYRILYNRGSI